MSISTASGCNTLILVITFTIIANLIVPIEPISFYAIGDAPYKEEEYELLKTQLLEIPRNDTSSFIVHLGDIMDKEDNCDETLYFNVDDVLYFNSPKPIFVIPGDNEWTDCPDPALGWHRWEKYFGAYDNWWDHGLSVTRSSSSSSPIYPDEQQQQHHNTAFVADKTLFIGLSLPGTLNGTDEMSPEDAIIWEDRYEHNFEWTKQMLQSFIGNNGTITTVVILGHAKHREKNHQFFDKLFLLIIQKYQHVHFMYLHGDGHRFHLTMERSNFIDMQVDRGAKAPPVKITVERHAWNISRTFRIDRRGGRYEGDNIFDERRLKREEK